MATYDNSVLAQGASVTTLASGAFTIASGAALAVHIADRAQGSITTVVNGAVSCSSAGSTTGSSRRTHIYTTTSPESGSTTVTLTGNGSYGDNSFCCIVGLSATETGSFADYTGATGTGTAPSVTVTNAATGDLISDICYHGNLGAAGANQTQRQAATSDTTKVSTQAGADGGVMDYAAPESLNWAIAGIRFVAAAAGTTWGPLLAGQNNRLVRM